MCRSARCLLPMLCALWLSPSAYAQSADTTRGSAQAEALFVRALTEVFLEDHEQAITLLDRVLELRPREPAVLAALAESHKAMGHSAEALYFAAEAVEHSRDEPDFYLTLAKLQTETNQPEAAIATYEALLRLTPANTAALRDLGRLHERTGQYEEALRTYQQLLELDPENAALLLRMEAIYARLGDPTNALRMLEAAVATVPNERTLLIRLGMAYRDAARWPDAADVFEQLVARDAGDSEAVLFLAGALDAMGETERAAILRNGLQTTDSPEDRLRQAALLYAQIEDNPDAADEALHLLEPFAEDDNAPTEALFMLGDLLYHARDHGRAAEVLMRALDDDPRKPGVWEQAAASFFYDGQIEEAIETTETALLLFPGQVGLLRLQGYALAKAERPREALQSLDKAIQILAEDGDQPKVHARLLAFKGVLHDELGETAEADAAFEVALEVGPGNALALNNYAYILAERGERLNDALAMAEEAVAAYPDNAYFLDTLGWVYFKLERLDEAAEAIERAVAADNQFPILLEHLGDIYAAQGRDAEARTAWERALDLDPDNETLREKLSGR
ncbi:MAG: tetratricopeptide repeat protein [Rhodothermaceae bacterium]|nr:tetratricopeptide repeat protein [Rhodothermaceae bacterium]